LFVHKTEEKSNKEVLVKIELVKRVTTYMKESNTSGRDWLLCEDPRNQYGEERNQGIRRDPAAVLQGRSLFWARPTP